LLDLKKAGYTGGEIDTIIRSLSRADQKDLLRKADAINDAHSYPDKRITYTMRSTYPGCKSRYYLSVQAQAVLSLCEGIANQSGLLQITVAHIVAHGQVGERMAKAALKELREAGMLAIHTPKRGNQPPIYMLNPLIARTGRAGIYRTEAFWELAGADAQRAYYELEHKAAYTTATVRVDAKAGQDAYKYNYIVPVPPDSKEKEPSDRESDSPIIDDDNL
jgi:hypothetical protein